MKKTFLIVSFFLLLVFEGFSQSTFRWQDQIIYMVMIDRFSNGNPSNDRQTETGIEAGNVNSKYNGGDLQGLINRLDYIKELGVTAIWITPPVANQWWDDSVDYGGYHGYWARDFSKIDEHFGTNELYTEFVKKAHEKGLYVIQDIVPNHTGNFIIYSNGKYSLNEKSIPVSKPQQYPFNMNDFNDPKQRELAIYHFPSLIGELDIYNTSFSDLDDINTENPQVRKVLKEIYGNWIETAGIDGFRVDTAKYVEKEFWQDFFKGENNIYEKAQSLGKDNFIAFGETWISPNPYENTADIEINKYFDYGFNSMLDFGLLTDIKRVFKEGKPTSYLEYRLTQRQEVYKDPSMLVTFVDNHDMDRFLKGATINDLKIALTLLYTIPGIPQIYYGTEQGFTETRAAMFKEGFSSMGEDHFNSNSDLFKFIQTINKMRKEIPTFRYGRIKVLFSDSTGPGILCYSIEHENEKYLILMNTNSKRKYATGIKLEIQDGTVLKPVMSMNVPQNDLVYEGKLDTSLNEKSFIIYKVTDEKATLKPKTVSVQLDMQLQGKTFSDDFYIKGRANGAKSVRLIIDGDDKEYAVINLSMKENEEWSIPVKIADFTPGKHTAFVKVFGKTPLFSDYSPTVYFSLDIPQNELAAVEDPLGDDNGPQGKYSYPKDLTFKNQQDMLGARVQQIGTMLSIEITMRELSDVWGPANGFDHVTFQIFLDSPNKKGVTALPKQNALMPAGLDWDYQLYITGWSCSAYNSTGAGTDSYGLPVTPAPGIKVEKQFSKITFSLPLSVIETNTMKNWNIYITTYDYDGIEAVLRPISPQGGQWAYSGGQTDSPKIMDDLLINIK